MEFLQQVKENFGEPFALETALSTVYFMYDHDRYFIWTSDGHKNEFTQQEAQEKYEELTNMKFEPRPHGGKREGAGRRPKGEAPKVAFPVSRVASDVAELVRQQDNMTEYVETAIRFYESNRPN